ncbi:hypothetical protein ANN_22030 [Periplaneta americana]|uniref:RNase H type-1 domain-containing protein n=1 Tax=Periplaneta americana TaxID=6978 RepID=A0ABQ8S7F2_PERAM|nr:hypothetical protein ANN_22030 [Periplaneta americana]
MVATLGLTLREEQRLRVFENKVLRKIFGAKRDEVTGEWRKLHNAELHALYSSPDIIRNIKSRCLRWAGHVARMGESRNAYRVIVGRPKGKDLCGGRDAVILSDSKAAILSIVSKHTPSSQTAEITKMLSQLISLNKRIVFQWIPSHCGILGNENADALVKKGSTATYRPVTKSTYYSVKRFIKSTYLDFNKQNLITQSQGKRWNSLHHNPQLIPDLSRKSSVAAFRLATGHDCLAKHLHRIGIYQSPNCPLCNSNQEMDSEHLKICASVAGHDNIFEKYWSARGQMTLLSNAWH